MQILFYIYTQNAEHETENAAREILARVWGRVTTEIGKGLKEETIMRYDRKAVE